MRPFALARNVALSSLLAACSNAAPRASSPVTLAVFVSGDERAARRWPRSLTAPSRITLRRAELAAETAENNGVTDRGASAVTTAASAFASADFARCSHALDDVAVHELLARSRRDLAARTLMWTAACALADDRRADAERAATQLATLELEIPAVVTRPDVEGLVASTLASVAARPRRSITIRSNARSARVAIDGTAARCTAPCTVELHSGEHVVVVSADRFEPASATFSVGDAPALLDVTLTPASAARAAEQWNARERANAPSDSADSMALLSTATAARRIARIDVDQEHGSSRLRAVLAIDGAIASRSEQRSTPEPRDEDASALVRDLLVRGRVIEPARPLYTSPWFWVAIGVAAGAGVGVSAWYFTRPIETAIRFTDP